MRCFALEVDEDQAGGTEAGKVRSSRRRHSRALVSVVVAAFDEEAFIAEALGSVLAQTYRDVEVIVVDDGSSDRTVEIAQELGARVLRQTHEGAAAARNAGLAVASGEYGRSSRDLSRAGPCTAACRAMINAQPASEGVRTLTGPI